MGSIRSPAASVQTQVVPVGRSCEERLDTVSWLLSVLLWFATAQERLQVCRAALLGGCFFHGLLDRGMCRAADTNLCLDCLMGKAVRNRCVQTSARPTKGLFGLWSSELGLTACWSLACAGGPEHPGNRMSGDFCSSGTQHSPQQRQHFSFYTQGWSKLSEETLAARTQHILTVLSLKPSCMYHRGRWLLQCYSADSLDHCKIEFSTAFLQEQ